MIDVPQARPDATAALTDALRSRILLLDGAMGTMVQRHQLSESDYRGERLSLIHISEPTRPY